MNNICIGENPGNVESVLSVVSDGVTISKEKEAKVNMEEVPNGDVSNFRVKAITDFTRGVLDTVYRIHTANYIINFLFVHHICGSSITLPNHVFVHDSRDLCIFVSRTLRGVVYVLTVPTLMAVDMDTCVTAFENYVSDNVLVSVSISVITMVIRDMTI